MVVLPVDRSPMISSRWPRPIGIIESTALRPVWSGWFTGWRSTTPGAPVSIRRRRSATIGPLPSIGTPSPLTTRPTSASPAGTSALRHVRRLGSVAHELLTEAPELAGDAAVDDGVAEAEDHSADQVRIDLFGEFHRLTGAPPEGLGEAVPFFHGKTHGDGGG